MHSLGNLSKYPPIAVNYEPTIRESVKVPN